MASYDYRCPAEGCGHAFEKSAPMGQAPPEAACPECGRPAKKQFFVVHTRRPSKSLDSADAITRYQFRELG